ncbi:MFS transporter [Streptomyces sp. NPDC059893]|uniref:MFS transporter n=1 Tax=Streptomyces sp. NPDC059893 TaxID=3346990 RepID=UPI003654555A
MDEPVRKAFRNDGAVLLKDCLDAAQLTRCHAAFDWAVANPGPHASSMFDGTEQRSHVDNANPLAKDHLDELVTRLPLGKLFAELWGSDNIWYSAEEIFLKAGGVGSRSAWHQDTAHLPWAGEHWGNAWISFQPIPRQNSLEIVRGSRHGIQYDGTTFANPDDPTEPRHREEIVRRLEARALRRGPLPEPQLIETGARRLGLRDIFGNRRMLFTVLVLSAGYFGSTLGLYLYQNWPTYALVDGLGYSESTAYGIIMTWSIVYAVTPFLALVLMDRIERKTLVLSMSVISALPILLLGLSANSTVVLVAGGAAGIVTGIVLTVYYAYIPETIPTEARGLGSGIIISVGRVGGAASGVLGAALYAGWGRAGLMAVAAASYVVFSIVVLLFGPRTANRPLEGVTADDLSAAK